MEKEKTIVNDIDKCYEPFEKWKEDKELLEMVLDRWEQLGFIEGLNGDNRERTAVAFEQMASIMVNANEGKFDEKCEVVIFPVIRMLMPKVVEKYSTKKVVDSIKGVNIKEISESINISEKIWKDAELWHPIAGLIFLILDLIVPETDAALPTVW